MRLIDADALMKAFYKSIDDAVLHGGKIVPFQDIIQNAPTIEPKRGEWIDAVPVVRCKDCKYYDTPKNFKKPYCMRGAYVKVDADDYCSKGERK